MPLRKVIIPAIALLFFVVLIGTFLYGPTRRIFAEQSRTVTVWSAGEIDDLWHASRVHGRVAVLFTRHLNNQFSGMAFPEIDYLDTAMRQGIVRKAYYVVPDEFWKQVDIETRGWREYIVEPIVTECGLLILHEGGRIHVLPLSKYIPEQEKSLVVYEPAIWTQQERNRIEGFIRSGQLATDLSIIVGDAQ